MISFTVCVLSSPRFDMLVNGGGSVTLLFQRHPFEEKQTTVMVPWNHIVTMDAVTLTLAGEAAGSDECVGTVHDYYDLRPVILSTWQHTQLGACPSRSTIIPESQVGGATCYGVLDRWQHRHPGLSHYDGWVN